MKKLKAIIRIENTKKAILLTIVCVVLFLGYFILGVTPKNLFQENCIVETEEDIKKCEGKYATVKVKKVYDTEYEFQVNGEASGRFIDLDFDGKSLIAIVKKDQVKDLFQGEEEKVIEGKLEAFTNKGMKKGYEEIVNSYVKKFGENATEEGIKSAVFSVQLNAYHNSKQMAMICFVCLTVPLVLTLVALVVVLKRIFIISIKGKKSINEIVLEEELANGPYLYKRENFLMTNTFAVSSSSRGLHVEPIEKLVWMYERKVTQLGSSQRKKYLILCFENHNRMKVKFDNPEAEKVIQLLTLKKPDMIAGYSKEALKQWKQK